MLSLDLVPIFKARGIERPYTFLVKAGLSPHSATSIINSQSRVFRLDHVELLCSLLHCTPNDILIWLPDKNKKIPDNHPLTNLRKKKFDSDWVETLKTIPIDKLNEIASILKNVDKSQK